MAVGVGTVVGPYTVTGTVGAGGMGVVYRARDARLERDVAVKMLTGVAATDTARVQRFEQEARAAAGLSHPNILAVFDVGTFRDGDADAPTPYIVSELLDGATLRSHLEAGGVSVKQAVGCTAQVARGLAAAHEKGIVHRDLKPENLFLTSDGRVKILDFGLAKLTHAEGTAAHASSVPTVPPRTTPGLVLGTVGYMAPEQVRGLAADHRADIFALGVVLYELLAGTRAFAGATAADTLSAILKEDPAELPATERHIPPGLVRIVGRCLEKAPAARFQSAHDLAFALDALSTQTPSGVERAVAVPARGAASRPWVARIAWGVAGLAFGGVATFFVSAGRGNEAVSTEPIRFEFEGLQTGRGAPVAGAAGRLANEMAVSPDGRFIAVVTFTGTGEADSRPVVVIRSLASLETRVLSGTEGVSTVFWSPDSRAVAFTAGRRLQKQALSGGTPDTLCELPAAAAGGSWSVSDQILVGSARGLLQVSSSGGECKLITEVQVDSSREPSRSPQPGHVHPQFLPDGERYLFTDGLDDGSRVTLGRLGTNERTPLLNVASKAAFVEPGFLVYHRNGTLYAQRLSPTSLEPLGEPVVIDERLATVDDSGPVRAGFSVGGGTLATIHGQNQELYQFVWTGRTGQSLGLAGPARNWAQYFDLSQDGRQIAVSRRGTKGPDVWLLDWARGVEQRYTFDESPTQPGLHRDIAWSPGGDRLAYSSFKKANNTEVVIGRISGGGSRDEQSAATGPGARVVVEDWSKDGRFLLYLALGEGLPSLGNQDIWAAPLFGDGKPFPVVQSPFRENEAHLSWDGKWLAYNSNDSGSNQVWVVSFPSVEQKRQISNKGGSQAHWRRDGKELYYLAPDGKMMAVDMSLGSKLDSGVPRVLFDTGLVVNQVQDQYRVTPDGQRFLLLKPVNTAPAVLPIKVTLNWAAALKQ